MQVSIEWIAVTDRLPDDDERVMIVNAGDVEPRRPWSGYQCSHPGCQGTHRSKFELCC